MDFLVSHWELIVALISVIVMIVMFVINFAQKPTPQQIQQVREWALFFVFEAEKLFGSKMGKLKLRYVYDKFLERFNWLSKIVSFEQFSSIIDDALADMKRILENNTKAQEYVGVEIKPEEEKKEETSPEA